MLDRLGGIYYKRWGDAPIKSLGLALSLDLSEVHCFSDLAYTHLPFVDQTAVGLPTPGVVGETQRYDGGTCELTLFSGWVCTGLYANGTNGTNGTRNGSNPLAHRVATTPGSELKVDAGGGGVAGGVAGGRRPGANTGDEVSFGFIGDVIPRTFGEGVLGLSGGALGVASERVKGAIYLISHAVRIDSLVKSVRSIHKHFNARYRYPIVIFTEGDFEHEHILRVHEAAGVTGAAAAFANGTLTTAALTRLSTVSFYRIELEVPAVVTIDVSTLPERTACDPERSTLKVSHGSDALAATP